MIKSNNPIIFEILNLEPILPEQNLNELEAQTSFRTQNCI